MEEQFSVLCAALREQGVLSIPAHDLPGSSCQFDSPHVPWQRVSPLLLPGRGCVYRPLHPSVRGRLGSRGWSTRDEDIKADSDPMRQRPYYPQDPQVSWLLGTLGLFPWGSLWHWLGSKLIDMHTWWENPVSCAGNRELRPLSIRQGKVPGLHGGWKMLFSSVGLKCISLLRLRRQIMNTLLGGNV